MVSLNNRIYFREHGSSVVHSSANHNMESDHRLGETSHHLHQVPVGTPTRLTTIGNDFRLDRMSSHAIEFGRVKEDIVSLNSEP